MKQFIKFLKGVFELVSLFPVITIILILAIVSFVLSKNSTKAVSINETWCAQIQQYDSLKKSITTYYNPAIIKDSELLYVQLINGTKYYKKDFLTGSELDYDLISHVVTKNGVQFKITLLQMGGCGTKTEMDSIAKAEKEPNQEEMEY